MYKFQSTTTIAVSIAAFVVASSAFAHVVVKPNQVGVGQFQTFTVGVPVEQAIPTVGLRLAIPAGLKYVTPNVKPGWKIEVKKNGTGEDAIVTDIIWSGGSIPAGQRDEFAFSAQVSAQEATVQWNAYQTYQGGTVVAWDQPRNEDHKEFTNSGPYSETTVVNDLTAKKDVSQERHGKEFGDRKTVAISAAALVISILALILQFRNRK